MEWAGHTCRMDKSRTPRHNLEGKIYSYQQAVLPNDRWG
jgi:hypothetical protein